MICKVGVKFFAPPGEVRQIFRDTVLLTEDRNLRVKCLARDVPVRTIVDFMKWATQKQ
jgi:protein SMG6